MAWQWTPYTILPLVAAATLIITALYILWQRRHRPASRAGALVLLTCAELMVAYTLEIGSTNLPIKLFWNKMQYVGLAIAPTAWLVYTLHYIGREKWLTRRTLALLSIVPLITLLLAFTNEAHGLIWRHVWLDTDGPFLVFDKIYGVGFWVFVVYSCILLLLATFLYIQMFIRSRHFYRWQVSALVFGALLPWLGSMLDVFKLSPLPKFVPTSLGFIVGGLTVAFTIYRLRLGYIVPVARGVVVESMIDGVIVLDAQNRIVDLNPVARHLIGHTLSETIGQPMEELWPHWPSQMESPLNGAKVGKEVELGKAGEMRIYDVRISPLVDWRGRLVGRVVVLRDITGRVRAEEALRRERDMAEALEEAAAVVSSTLDPDQVLDRILEQVSRVVPNDATNIMLIDGAQVLIVRWRGYERFGGEELVSTVVLRIPEVASLQQMMDSREPMVIPDTATYPGWIHVPLTEWLRSYAAAPIIVRGEVIGFLNVDSATPGFFTQAHAETLRAFADHAAAAIENARLYEAEQERRYIAETLRQASAVLSSTLELDEVLELILQQLRQVIPYDSVSIQRLQDDALSPTSERFRRAQSSRSIEPSKGERLEIVACQGFEKPDKVVGLVFPLDPKFPNHRVVTTKAPLAIEDVTQDYSHFKDEADTYGSDRVRSWLGVPLMVKDEVIGMIAVDREEVRPYTAEEVQLAMAFANQAAIAIENARLYEQAQQEITERVRAEGQIKTSLREKEVLLKEIHHRVKNNLQVISSLLYLQSKNVKDQRSLEILQDSQNRVRSMALVHERLYQSQDLARVDFAKYVRSLVNHLFRSYGVNTNVTKLRIQVEDVFLGVDTAIPCGLIINELVSNSLKHAFPDGREGEIHIEFRANDGQFRLVIRDNGVGFPTDLDFRNTKTLGLQLVSTLVHQLEGTIKLDRSGGTAFEVTFAEPK